MIISSNAIVTKNNYQYTIIINIKTDPYIVSPTGPRKNLKNNRGADQSTNINW